MNDSLHSKSKTSKSSTKSLFESDEEQLSEDEDEDSLNQEDEDFKLVPRSFQRKSPKDEIESVKIQDDDEFDEEVILIRIFLNTWVFVCFVVFVVCLFVYFY